MKNKVIKIPISSVQRWKNRFGRYCVPCMISQRWLQFSETSSSFADSEAIFLDVMTIDSKDEPRKILRTLYNKGRPDEGIKFYS